MDKNNLLSFYSYTRFAFWFAILIFSQVLYYNKIVGNTLFQKLGKNSYAVYLFHPALIYFYDKWMPDITGRILIDWSMKYGIILISSYLLSLVWMKCAENIKIWRDKHAV